MKKFKKTSPLKYSGPGSGYTPLVPQTGGNAGATAFGVTTSSTASISTLNAPPRPEINDLCDIPEKRRPVFVLEKHMTVARKGPTMPLTLEMYSAAEETTNVNTTTDGAIIAANFLGGSMDKSSNYCVDPSIPGGLGCGISPANTRGISIDGKDVSMFYDRYREPLVAGDEIRIPIDINDNTTGSGGQDWGVGDQLIIEHEWIDVYNRRKKASSRVEIINPAQTRWMDDGSGVQNWDVPWSPYNTYGCSNPAAITDPAACSSLTIGDSWGEDPENRTFVLAKIMSVSGFFPRNHTSNEDVYSAVLVQIPPLFKVKFPKFSYRYKYQDGEYSVFAPWSEVAFIPQKFDFSPKKGYNLGMENGLRALKVLNWRPKDCPEDVVQIDILYKESNSPNIYTVESFKQDDPNPTGSAINHWNTPANGGHYGKYTIKTELIHQVVASNQLLRPWDNIPRKALAQEITANRLIFANYLQQYNLDYLRGATKIPIKPEFIASVEENNPWSRDSISLGLPVKSLKSQRTYQLGVVYRDRYGRETPVLTSSSGSVEIAKKAANSQNRLNVQLLNNHPYWAESYTFYIKETSNEYYNLAMDRWYNAEDGGVWLSFPSVERNKINEETNLILKKKHDSDEFTDYDVSYKILSIKNNAPKFIKTDKKYWGALPIHLPPPGWGDVGNWDSGMLYPSGLPLPSRMNIDVIAEYFDQSVLQNLTSSNNAQVRIVQSPGLPSAFNATTSDLSNKTLWYNVANITHIGSPSLTQFDADGNEIEVPSQVERLVRISLETAFGVDAQFCESDSVISPLVLNTANSNISMTRGLLLEARTHEEKDKAQFEGRFFVKLLRDGNIEANIIQAQQTESEQYQVLESKDIKYLCTAHPGMQDWNNSVYIPPSVQLNHPIASITTGNDPTHANFLVSSFGPNAALTSASYRDSIGAVQTNPQTAPYWPYGPGEFTDGVYTSNGPNNGYWFSINQQYLDNSVSPTIFPASQTTENSWPAFPIGYWNPLNYWGGSPGGVPPFGVASLVSTNTEWDMITSQNTVYDHLLTGIPGVSTYSSGIKRGILDLSKGQGGSFAGNGIALATTNTSSFLDQLDYSNPGFDNNIGYMAGANPYLVPAIWGDQSDFLVDTTGVVAPCSGSWPAGCMPIYDSATPSKLRKYWWNLWQGKNISETWPRGSFHPDRWFFDKVGAAGGYSGNGIWDDTVTGNSYMDLSYWGPGNFNEYNRESGNIALMEKHQPTETTFNNLITTQGTQFRFKQDPDQIVYTVIKVDTTENVWNYEAPQGQWAYEDAAGATQGGVGFTKGALPDNADVTLDGPLAGKTSFLSDAVIPDSNPNQKALTGGAPTNRRIRHQIMLDKIIGSEGPHAFHPITNHVDADGKANVKRGRQKYQVALGSGITAGDGGTPTNEEYYNLNSYWNTTSPPVNQPDDITDSFYTAAGSKAYIGLHEKGLNETTIEIVTKYTGEDVDFPISNNPAIWETEPKEDVGLDIYYAASPSFPIDLRRHRWDGNITGVDGKTGPDEIDSEKANWYDFNKRGEEIVKVGSIVSTVNIAGIVPLDVLEYVRVCKVQGDLIWLNQPFSDILSPGVAAILSPGTKIRIKWQGEGSFYGALNDEDYVEVFIVESLAGDIYRVGSMTGTSYTHNLKHGLSYYNCYSFGTGVESNRVRDDYNAVTIDKGVKASMPLAEQYKEERKPSSLIFSGIYNSTSGINRTNQFIQAEPITKDINPINGSIQKLFTRDTDLVTFCENKVFKILAQKDALFNADGKTNVTSNASVLGQTIPFSGDYGMSTNPESFASQSYRIYFTDKDRGAVLRLSKDGLTPISDQGMKDWFKDNLRFASKLIGSHDDREDLYNLTLETADQDGVQMAYTVSYTEKARGWVSFKSFIQQGGLSHKNIYYTFPNNNYNIQSTQDPWGVSYSGGFGSNAETYRHNYNIEIKRLTQSSVNGLNTFLIDNGVGTILKGMTVTGNRIPIDTTVDSINCSAASCTLTLAFSHVTTGVFLDDNTELTFKTARNTFYNNTDDNYSMLKVMFNGNQNQTVKRFKTLNYEGSQSRVSFGDIGGLNYQIVEGVTFGQEYYDNHPKLGWYVENIFTDLQEGKMKEFIDKENKWFNYIRGYEEAGLGDFLDTGEFSLQGLGFSKQAAPVYGCTDLTATNYNNLANIDDGSCTYSLSGCTNPLSPNYNPLAITDDGSCISPTYGCTDSSALNYNPLANSDDGSCLYCVNGCTDPLYVQYNPLATCDDGSCVDLIVYGCTDPLATNYDPNATVDDSSCIASVLGCTNPVACNYDPLANTNDGSCIFPDGCTDPLASNYDPTAVCDNGLCIPYAYGCTDPLANNYNALATADDGSCTYNVNGCTDITACNYDPNATVDDGSCILPDGCTDPLADNYDPLATCDDGSCIYPTACIWGCMDPSACNYDASATCTTACNVAPAFLFGHTLPSTTGTNGHVGSVGPNNGAIHISIIQAGFSGPFGAILTVVGGGIYDGTVVSGTQTNIGTGSLNFNTNVIGATTPGTINYATGQATGVSISGTNEFAFLGLAVPPGLSEITYRVTLFNIGDGGTPSAPGCGGFSQDFLMRNYTYVDGSGTPIGVVNGACNHAVPNSSTIGVNSANPTPLVPNTTAGISAPGAPCGFDNCNPINDTSGNFDAFYTANLTALNPVFSPGSDPNGGTFNGPATDDCQFPNSSGLAYYENTGCLGTTPC